MSAGEGGHFFNDIFDPIIYIEFILIGAGSRTASDSAKLKSIH